MYIKWTCKKIIAAFLKGLPEYKRRTFSFLEHLFFNLQIFMFLHYANEESDDVIGGSTKTVLHSIKNAPSLKNSAPQYFWWYFWFNILLFKWNYLWYWCPHLPHLHNTKTWISLKKDFRKENHYSSWLKYWWPNLRT